MIDLVTIDGTFFEFLYAIWKTGVLTYRVKRIFFWGTVYDVHPKLYFSLSLFVIMHSLELPFDFRFLLQV
jgi:hypothetical protein